MQPCVWTEYIPESAWKRVFESRKTLEFGLYHKQGSFVIGLLSTASAL